MVFAGGRQTGKSLYYSYSQNLCKEVMMTGQEICELMELKLGFAELANGRIRQRKKVKEYKFSRANWYVAEFDDKYYFEVQEWCEQHFGKHPKNPDAWSRWVHKYSQQIHFRDEKDYEWFVLRWG